MNELAAEIKEKIRQHFDHLPYPKIPVEISPKEDYQTLYQNSLVTPYYLRSQAVIDSAGKVILDAGCGSGYQALVLAEANPGAKIIGIDLSEKSVELARSRLYFHGFENVEFHVLAIEDLPQLGVQFDYINCEEVLYLLPDLVVGLRALKAVLKSDGVIRGNLHSAIQRFALFRAQNVFKSLGLFDSELGDLEIEAVVETFKAFKPEVDLKRFTWKAEWETDTNPEAISANYLLRGDKGYTITELFAALKISDLELISMVDWRRWQLLDLFQDPDDLPILWEMSLPELSLEQQLQLHEWIHPRHHRLLDFWCGHANYLQCVKPVVAWSKEDWSAAKVYLHPRLKTAQIKADLCQSIHQRQPFILSRYLPDLSNSTIALESPIAASLLPLWESPQLVQVLVDRWLKICPVNLQTLEPTSPELAWNQMAQKLLALETFLYVFLELPSEQLLDN
jgi:2-polyprenyl-3-methyl-5-hydroxy-6-metoxy-1,4-benzoquinol methylase